MTALVSYALTNVADVKESLGISSGDHSKDNLITRKINQATDMIENYCNRHFASTVYTDEVYDGVGGNTTNLSNRPVTAFTSLSIRDSTTNQNNWEVIDSTFYYVDVNAGILEYLGSFYGNFQRWKVTYTAGYTTIPNDLAEACATLAAYLTARGPGTYDVQQMQEGQRMTRYDTNPNVNVATDDIVFAKVGILGILDNYTTPVISGRP